MATIRIKKRPRDLWGGNLAVAGKEEEVVTSRDSLLLCAAGKDIAWWRLGGDDSLSTLLSQATGGWMYYG